MFRSSYLSRQDQICVPGPESKPRRPKNLRQAGLCRSGRLGSGLIGFAAFPRQVAWLIILVALSLVWNGCLIWIDNSIAVIPFTGPVFHLDLTGNCPCTDQGDGLCEMGRPPSPLAGALLLRGNGDLDDNRSEVFSYPSIFSRIKTDHPPAAVTDFDERQTTAAYRDFGHLKVMPDGESEIHLGLIIARLRVSGAAHCMWAALFR